MTDEKSRRVGEIINRERERLQWSVTRLAAECGLQISTLWRYLNGKQAMPFESVDRALGLMGRDLCWLEGELKRKRRKGE